MFRSKRMHYFELLFSRDSAYEMLDVLGHLEIAQFVDLNQGVYKTQLHNIAKIKRTEDLLVKLEKVTPHCNPD